MSAPEDVATPVPCPKIPPFRLHTCAEFGLPTDQVRMADWPERIVCGFTEIVGMGSVVDVATVTVVVAGPTHTPFAGSSRTALRVNRRWSLRRASKAVISAERDL